MIGDRDRRSCGHELAERQTVWFSDPIQKAVTPLIGQFQDELDSSGAVG